MRAPVSSLRGMLRRSLVSAFVSCRRGMPRACSCEVNGVIAGLADEALVPGGGVRADPAGQEDAEPDEVGVRRDLGGDLIPGPRAGSRGEVEVVDRVFPGIWAGWLQWPGVAWAGDAEYQSGAAVRLGSAQFAAEGDGAAAIVVGFDFLGEEGESGRLGDGRGQDRPDDAWV